MKTFMSIKWELILTLLLGAGVIVGYFVLTDDMLGCIMEVILVFAFTSMLVVYKDLKEARKMLRENL